MERDHKTNSRSVITIGTAIIFIQLVDIIIHVLADQVELIRILSNFIIMLWVLSSLFSFLPRNQSVSYGVLILYLVLNIVFLFSAGLLNTYGDPRIMFFILVILTTILSILFIRQTN